MRKPRGCREASAVRSLIKPQIAPKWLAADGKSFWLVWTDFQVTDQESARLDLEANKRNVRQAVTAKAMSCRA
jgi:hypothetical protein